METDERPPLYTKTGDDGTTGRLFGGRVSKSHPAVEVYGCIDEAVAALGLARASLMDEELAALVLGLQRGLFVAGAEIAANPDERSRLVGGVSLVTAEMVAAVEEAIDQLTRRRPTRPAFIVPGATIPSAALDLARTVLRRVERGLVGLIDAGISVRPVLLAYINRSSDLTYALARSAAGEAEELLSR